MKAIFLVILVMGFTVFAPTIFAQKKNFGIQPTEIRPGSLHEGDLFTIKMVPGDKETSFFVVGKKTGSIKLDQLKMSAMFDEGGAPQRIALPRKDQAFILPRKIDKEFDLEVKGEAPGEVEKLHIKVKPQP